MPALNTVIAYSAEDQLYHVSDADTDNRLFSKPSLQDAWDEIKDECERRGVAMGDCDYHTRGPDVWDEVHK